MIHHNLATSFSFQVRKLRYPLVFIYYATSSSIGGILTQSRSSIACLWRGAVGSDTSHEKGPEAREFEPRRRHLFQHPRKHPLSFPRVMFFGFLLVCWVWDCLFVFFFFREMWFLCGFKREKMVVLDVRRIVEVFGV
jgi:hypothetical protein